MLWKPRAQHKRLGDIVTQMRAGESVGEFVVGIPSKHPSRPAEKCNIELRVGRFDADATFQMHLPEIDGVKAVGRIDRLVGAEVRFVGGGKRQQIRIAVKSARERPILGNGPS